MLLPLLLATADQMNLRSGLSEINAIAGAKVDSEFRKTIANGLAISKVSVLDTIDTEKDNRQSFRIELIEPLGEGLASIRSLADNYFSGK